MIKVLYVGGKPNLIPKISDTEIKIDHVQNGMIALSAIQTQAFDTVIIENHLPLMKPTRLIKEFKSLELDIPVICIVRDDSRRLQILDEIGLGIFGWYEPENSSIEYFISLIKSSKEYHDFLKEVPKISKRFFKANGYHNIVGTSKEMIKIYHMLVQIKNKDVTTILYGESGTGKNLIANTIHETGLRRDRPMVAVNCPAIPSELLESELFGHEKGSFTGAVDRKDGKFLAANAGTIFLDEIGDMSPSLQSKVLRVLESGEIERVGGAQTIKVSVRIISATNQNLEQRIKDGLFRQDLYHRINVFPITVPCLRDRILDIPLTAMAILHKLSKKHKTNVKYISPDGIDLLMSYSWDGNVRELEHILERIVLISDIPILTENEIKAHLDIQLNIEEKIKIPVEKEKITDYSVDDQSKLEIPEGNQNNLIDVSTIKTLKELEFEAIKVALERNNWNMTTTSKQLGISRMTLYRKLDQHNLQKNGK
tara:strand:- start:1233 stop:2678 length:1446 start_codon:yes stop_codon:yes gene_type:complete